MKKEEKCLAALNWKTFDGYVHVTIVFASVSSITTYIKETFKLYYCCTCIKTHGSVSCGPRSRRVTPVSILTGRKKTQFSHLRSSVHP